MTNKTKFIKDIYAILNLKLNQDWDLYHKLIVATVAFYKYNFAIGKEYKYETDKTAYLNAFNTTETEIEIWMEKEIEEFLILEIEFAFDDAKEEINQDAQTWCISNCKF